MSVALKDDEYETSGHISVIGPLAFLTGVAVGAVAALAMAPASGRDTRAYLKRRGEELAHDAAEKGRDAWRAQSDRMTSAVSSVKEAAEPMAARVRDRVKDAVDEGRAVYRQVRDEARDTLESH